MRVGILGPLQVVAAGGEIVEIGGARLRALLVRLALDAGRTVTVGALADALWPDGGSDDPGHALQALVSRLRRALPETGAVRSVPGGYRLELPPEAVDAARFERLARDGRRALRDGDAAAAVPLLGDALVLWRGEPLAEAGDAPYAQGAVVRLRELRAGAVEDRAEARLLAGRAAAPVVEDGLTAGSATGTGEVHLVAELEELAATHPLRERTRALLIRALHADGRPAEALAAYEDFRRRVADGLGTDPGPVVREAHLAVLRGEPVPRRGAPRRTASRGNLRADPRSLVGRERERAWVADRLRTGRLVTLVGPGGVGKTRLATAIAAGLAADPGANVPDADVPGGRVPDADGPGAGVPGGRVPDADGPGAGVPGGDVPGPGVPGGVWLVELAPVTDPGDVLPAVAGALGRRDADLDAGLIEAPSRPRDAVSRLAGALAGAATILVLDNCEHLLDAVAPLVEDLLGRCPLLRVLATSREALGVGGETLCPVPPLGLPAPGAPAEESLARPAVRLFAERAAAVRPDFTVTEANVAVVAEICRRLDGLPLAIELAAARLRSLPVEELAARLDDRFGLLTGGGRTALPRHRTLRAVIDGSWDALPEKERRLAGRLAVFPGGAGLEGAEVVAGATLDDMTALVDKSLVGFDGARYRMLETIREYAVEKLADGGELPALRAAHAAYFLSMAERAEPYLRGPDQVAWLRTLETERDNLLAALRFTCDRGDAATAVRLAAALGPYWMIRGDHVEGTARLRRALELPGAADPERRTVATVFFLLNAVLSGGPRIGLATGMRREELTSAEAAAHPAVALLEPVRAVFDDDAGRGLAAGERSSHPDPWARAMLWLIRVFLRGSRDGVGAMRDDLMEAVAAFREAGERWGLAQVLTYLAYTRITDGEFDAAVAGLEEAIRLLRELEPGDAAVLQRVMLATAHVQRGDVARARAGLLDLVASGGANAGSLVFAHITLGDLARRDGDLEEAARRYDAAEADLGRAPADSSPFRAMLAAARSQLATARGEPAAACRYAEESIAAAVAAPDPPIMASTAIAVALMRAAADPGGAAELVGAAHALRGAPDEFHPDVTGLARDLRARLGERAYTAAYARGSGLDRAGALALVKSRLGFQARRR